MRAAAALLIVMVVLGTGCMRPAARVPFPETPELVTVVARNHTGDDLVVAGTSILERAFEVKRVTVPDVLADEAESLLRARGLRVRGADVASTEPLRGTSSGAEATERSTPGEGAILYLDVRRWEADADTTHPAFVIVGVDASLVEAQSGRELWSAHPRVHPIATQGTILLGDAYALAARKVVAELLAQPAPSRR